MNDEVPTMAAILKALGQAARAAEAEAALERLGEKATVTAEHLGELLAQVQAADRAVEVEVVMCPLCQWGERSGEALPRREKCPECGGSLVFYLVETGAWRQNRKL